MSKNENILTLSVVILNYNGAHHLRTFLPSVLKNTASSYEVIVIDNGSTDESIELLKDEFSSVKIISLNKNHGFCGGYNKGLEQVSTDIFVLLNSDVEVTPNWLNAPLSALQNDHTIGACQPKIRAYNQKKYFEYAGAAGGKMDVLNYAFALGRLFDSIEEDKGQYDISQEIFWASGAALFVRKKLFLSLGGFDEDYFAHFEEIDLCWRIKNLGYKIINTPSSKVYHLGGGTLDYDNPRKVFYNFRNSLLTILKNEKPLKLCWNIPMRLILDGIAGLKYLTEGKIKPVVAIINAHFSFYYNFISALKKRCNFNAQRKQLKIGAPNLSGRSTKSILYYYFIKGVKKTERL